MSDINLTVENESLKILRESLGAMFGPKMKKDLNREIGINVREHVADHLARASVDRHKTADRLGAKHTGFLEFANTRGMRGGSNFKGDGPKPFTKVEGVTEEGVSVVIGNTPGLRRAFGPLTITPKRAKALTIPIDKDSYGVRARDFPRKLFCITSRKGHGLLVEEQSGRKSKKQRLRPKYLLVKKSVLKHDPNLLPNNTEIQEWSSDSIESFLMKLQG